MKAHFFNIHNFNLQKEVYGQPVEAARFQCEVCDASFKYRKGLNAHIRSKHGPNNVPKKTSDCDECPSKFKEKKNLNAHTQSPQNVGISGSRILRKEIQSEEG